MRHCSAEELIDAIEGARAEASLPHLAVCAECRTQLSDLRTVLSEVRQVPVPEPSATQWVRWSARLRESVASEEERAAAPWWPRWTWVASAVAVVVITCAVVVPFRQPPPPAVLSETGAGAVVEGGRDGAAAIGSPSSADLTDDPSLSLMLALADVVDLESEPAPVLMMGAGAVDEAVGELSVDEQRELARLLKNAMAGSGV
jgi:hypothetical protein